MNKAIKDVIGREVTEDDFYGRITHLVDALNGDDSFGGFLDGCLSFSEDYNLFKDREDYQDFIKNI